MIRKLLDSGVCFIVVQSYSYLTKARMMQNQEWEVIAADIDSRKLRGFGFIKNTTAETPFHQKNPEGIISKILKADEIAEFKQLLPDYFVKAKSTSDGTVWELKEKSFKQYFKAS